VRKRLLRLILSLTLKPFLQYYYLKSARPFKYNDLKLVIEPGIFHPGLFYSSKFLAGFVQQLELKEKRLLDMGCGSGLLSLVAAQKGAKVVSVDLNDLALKNTVSNAQSNNLDLKAIKSDVFEQVSGEFDFIIVNPPYYPRKPKSELQLAWYCGDNFDYFHRFFAGLNEHITPSSQVFMVMSDGCELEKISAIAADYQFNLSGVSELKTVLERNFVFRVNASLLG
jgi:release factor glutamine methyltransferase